MKASYQRPAIETMAADRILESLGPVSCGSNGSAGNSAMSPVTGSSGSGNLLGR
jgi:hypothetical protein